VLIDLTGLALHHRNFRRVNPYNLSIRGRDLTHPVETLQLQIKK
jgi:hypothetical protein